MLVSPNNEMAAMFVSRSNPPGVESYYYAILFSLKNMAVDHVSETQEFSKPGKNIFELRGAVLKRTPSSLT